jgi:phage tail sheath gpL-like
VGECGEHLQIAVHDAETVQPNQCARNAGEHQNRVDLPCNAVGAQAVPRVLEHEMQAAALLKCAVGGHDIRMGPG